MLLGSYYVFLCVDINDWVLRQCSRIAASRLGRHFFKRQRRKRRVGGENGAEYMHRILYGNPEVCQEQLRLTSDMVFRLVDIMRSRNLLTDGRKIHVPEQIGMCLYMLAKGASYRDIADTFKHSISAVRKYLKKVLWALGQLSSDIIRPHTSLEEVPRKIAESNLYYPFFKDCVGALDGTHITAVVGDETGMPYRGRKGTKTWNVLACCSFDMLFTYVHLGWEGSAHDTKVWMDSITHSMFCFPHPPPGKYYLVDSGYPNTLGYLAPYKEGHARYHMPEFRRGNQPVGMHENFNYRHSSLRTTIERCFGVLKNTWKVLRVMPQVSDAYQLEIILATFTLHNFIRMHELDILILEHCEVEGIADSDIFDARRKRQMKIVRDSIASQIMDFDQQYQADDV